MCSLAKYTQFPLYWRLTLLMGWMWINSILREPDKCYIANILLLRQFCHHITALVIGMRHTKIQNYKLVEKHTQIYSKAKRKHTDTRKMHTGPLIWACGIVTLLPDIPASGCQQGLQLEGQCWWQGGGGERDARVDRGQNQKFVVSHGQTGKIYDRSGSSSAA